jgi:citrate synthase
VEIKGSEDDRSEGRSGRCTPIAAESACRRAAEASGNEVDWRSVRNLAKAGSELLHDAPNLDFGLAAVTRTCRLPARAPLLLFALGRTIGWIAHAIEEYASGQLIRPRARYTGPAPLLGGSNV